MDRFDYAVTAADLADAPAPRLLAAVTVQVYDLPAVSPFTVMGLALPTVVLEPHFTAKPVIAAPLLFPALNDTVIARLPAAEALTCDTAAGVPIVTDPVVADGPGPEPVTAATVNVYVLPSVRPNTCVVVPGPAENVDGPEDGVIR